MKPATYHHARPMVRRSRAIWIRHVRLKRVASVSVGGTVGGLLLSPARKYLYCLNITEAQVVRNDTKTGKRDRVVSVTEGTDLIGLRSVTAQTLVTVIAADHKADCIRRPSSRGCS